MLKIDNFSGNVAIVNDQHFPDADMRAIKVSNRVMSRVKPSMIIIPGDLFDMYQLSKFDKNPQRIDKMQEEIDEVTNYLKVLRTLNPNARILLEEGNHEERLQRYLWTQSPGLSSLRALKMDCLLGLTDNGIEHVKYEDGVMINGTFLVLHGDLVRKWSGYTSRAMMEKHGGCGIHGHTHRGGSHYQVDRAGYQVWYENFCLCNLEPDYIRYPDWHHGMSIVDCLPSGRFFVQQIPIVDGECRYGGESFNSEPEVVMTESRRRNEKAD